MADNLTGVCAAVGGVGAAFGVATVGTLDIFAEKYRFKVLGVFFCSLPGFEGVAAAGALPFPPERLSTASAFRFRGAFCFGVAVASSMAGTVGAASAGFAVAGESPSESSSSSEMTALRATDGDASRDGDCS